MTALYNNINEQYSFTKKAELLDCILKNSQWKEYTHKIFTIW